MGLDWFTLFRPFLVMAIMLAAMWEPNRKPSKTKRRKDMPATKTDFHTVMELKEKFKPARKGVISDAEAAMASSVMELPERTDIEVQNIRDAVVAHYGTAADGAVRSGNSARAMDLMDAMSALTAVVDQEKCRRGLDV